MSGLAMQQVRIAYGSRAAVNDVSLAVSPGEVVALVGESGSGKSSLALAALGLLPPEATVTGTVSVGGRDLSALSPRELDRVRGRGIALVFQDPAAALNPRLRIGAQVAETIRVHDRISRRAADARAAEILARVGLPAAIVPATRYPHQLSGGQRQRVAIAVAIAAGPALLVADEPTSALDVTTQAQILALLRRLVAEDGMGLLLVSHDLAVVAEIADRILVMKDGAVVEEGRATALLARPASPYGRRLVASARAAVPARSPAAGPPLLEVRGISRRHGTATVLDDVSFTVGRGETVGLVGESGAGKTTLLRTVLALEAPQAGEVRLAGQSVTRSRGRALRRLRRDMQAVFQDPGRSLDPRHRVGRIVAEPLHLLDPRPGRDDRRDRVERVLREVGLEPADADLFPHQFSGGQRQRIALARALVVAPALVVLDEALSALDMSVRAEMLALLAELSVRRGLSYLFVSHDIALMRQVADRLVVLRDGRVLEQGPTADLMTAPQSRYTADLIAATPDLDAILRRRAGGT